MKKEEAVLGGGCFWCLDAVYRQLNGVLNVQSGYAGGRTGNPTYQQICSGATGHAEVVRIEFDAEQITFSQLLDVFWVIHDPTTLNRQGADVGTQYRSVIYFLNEQQQADAERSMEAAGKLFAQPIVTEIAPLETFWPGEAYHQDYYQLNGNQPYCQAVISPKLRKLREQFGGQIKA